jgi:hypothetical protein
MTWIAPLLLRLDSMILAISLTACECEAGDASGVCARMWATGTFLNQSGVRYERAILKFKGTEIRHR